MSIEEARRVLENRRMEEEKQHKVHSEENAVKRFGEMLHENKKKVINLALVIGGAGLLVAWILIEYLGYL